MLFIIKSRHACRHCGCKRYEARADLRPPGEPRGVVETIVACESCGMPPTRAALDAMQGDIAKALHAALYQSEG